MNKQKILIIGHTDGNGGAQTAFKKFVEFNVRELNNIRIIPISNYTDSEWYIKNSSRIIGRVLYKTPSISLKLLKAFQLFWTGVRIWFYNPDLTITVGLNNSSVFLSKFLRQKSFKVAQDFMADRPHDDAIWQTTIQHFDGIVLQSKGMIDHWKNEAAFKDGKLNWLPCFPEPPIANVLKSDKPSAGLKFAYFGRLAGNKGLDLLMSAISEMQQSQLITLDVWGKGDEEKSLKNLSNALSLDSVISFKGSFPSGRNGAELMASYDCLVLCSTKTEGLPLVLIEAMAYGLPLLVTDVGAIKDCTINNPDTVLVKPSKEQILLGINEVVQRKNNGMFNAERQNNYYNTHFSYEKMAGRWRSFIADPEHFFSN